MTHRTSPRGWILGAVAIWTGLLLGGCSWVPKGEPQFDVGIKDRGVASWYGGQFHGRQAADGTIFNMDGLTAAHRTMPLGSVIRVVNLENGKHLYVKVTDRGPYVHGRILDLSRAAAVGLGMERGGLAYVQIEIVGERRPDVLLSSDAVRGLLRWAAAGTEEAASPVVSIPIRVLPSDIWIRRGVRRVSAMLAADHTAHAEVTALVLA